MYATDMKQNYYELEKAAEAAATLTGYMENLMNYYISMNDYVMAMRINDALVSTFNKYSWGDHTDRWLQAYQQKKEELKTSYYEAT